MTDDLSPYQKATIVEATLSGRLPAPRCGQFITAWGALGPTKAWNDAKVCGNPAYWVLRGGELTSRLFFCSACIGYKVSTYSELIEFLPTGERVDREKIKSIASIRRAIRRIITAWR
jgi:hypothetical protein